MYSVLLLMERGSLALEIHLPDTLGQTAKLVCVQSRAVIVQSPAERDSLCFPDLLPREFPCASLHIIHNSENKRLFGEVRVVANSCTSLERGCYLHTGFFSVLERLQMLWPMEITDESLCQLEER